MNVNLNKMFPNLETMSTKSGKSLFKHYVLIPHHTMYGNYGNSANFRLPVFGGFTRFGVWRIQKNVKLPWCRVFVS